MSLYRKKKKDIYAYRRRISAFKHFEKLRKIVEQSNARDLEKFVEENDKIWWQIQEKLGTYKGIEHMHENRKTALEKSIEQGNTLLADPLAKYICRKCGKPGYLFSPNLDSNKPDLFVLHISWEATRVLTKFCYLGRTPQNLILLPNSSAEGVLTLS